MHSTIVSLICLSIITQTSCAQLQPVESGVYQWASHPVILSADRESRKILEGTSTHLEFLEIHATTQLPGAEPSTAHANADKEECIIVKEGTMKVTIEGESRILGPEGVILLMPQQMHNLENVGKTNLTYYVIQYKSRYKMDIERARKEGGSLMINADSLAYKQSIRGGRRSYFDRPTALCNRYEMHVTRLDKKGPSHNPHAHSDTEIILMISGNTEMKIDGKDYTAIEGDFYFIESQLTHGIRNTANEPSTYFAFKWK